MSRNVRMLAPVVTGANPTLMNPLSVNGRSYSASVGSHVDAPDFDAALLEANGWQRYAFVGTTSQRPTPQDPDFLGLSIRDLKYYDTSLSALLVFDGSAWHNAAGAVV
jgi:hypothetical protein